MKNFFKLWDQTKLMNLRKYLDNIKENENEDFMKLYQIWKNFDEGGKQKHKNEDRESISEEILNIEAMELFIDDVYIEYIDECTETNENASLENKSLNLNNICDNNIILDQTTNIVNINDQILSFAKNEITLEKSKNESLNLSNICENNIILDQTTKIVDINDQIPSSAGNKVTLEKSKQNEVVLPKVVFEEEAITVNRGEGKGKEKLVKTLLKNKEIYEDYEKYKIVRREAKNMAKTQKQKKCEDLGHKTRDSFENNQKMFYGLLRQLRREKQHFQELTEYTEEGSQENGKANSTDTGSTT
ncbi:hypothetical protein ILUMI_04174 [Ignelater luminosus]|uniref:Uncharacterized protein n=2 Tax=Ignelater luminosus TaxID=2038154 RepID=A0A8K0GJ95_IGNLU|nr:hypothetical protein ILUMI_04174 [Ignelater luminosus]